MAKLEKIVKSFLKKNKPAYYKFKDVIKVLKVLKEFGYKHTNTKGSHFIYEKGDEQITIVHHHKKVKKWYVKRLVELLDLEEWYENSKKH